jgi:hypothetical protein
LRAGSVPVPRRRRVLRASVLTVATLDLSPD